MRIFPVATQNFAGASLQEAVTHPPGDYIFRNYRLVPRSRQLLRDGLSIPIGSRAFDILHVLVRRGGTIVSKDEIVGAAWPATFVDESNLRFQVAQLRKSLGPDRDLVKTIPGRGYLFCGEGPKNSLFDGLEVHRDGIVRVEGRSEFQSQAFEIERFEEGGEEVDAVAQSHLQAFLAACGLRAERPVVLLVDLGPAPAESA